MNEREKSREINLGEELGRFGLKKFKTDIKLKNILLNRLNEE